MPRRRRTPRHSPRSEQAKRHHAARDVEAEIRVLVYTRESGHCAITDVPIGYSTFACHHRKLRSQGGGDGPENRLALSVDAHTADPGAVHRIGKPAYDNGWLVRSTEDPAKRQVLMHDGWWWLTPDGRREPAPEPARDPSSPGSLANQDTVH